MSDFETNWTKEELTCYLLIFCANADFIERKEESDMILSKVSDSCYVDLHAEFDRDNDYQSIQKIRSTIERFNYTNDEIELLLEEIKLLFNADGEYDTLERNMMIGLRRIIKD